MTSQTPAPTPRKTQQPVFLLVRYRAEVVGAYLSEQAANDAGYAMKLPELCAADGGSWKIAPREVTL